MATSGTTTFSEKCDELILHSLGDLGLNGAGMTPSAEDMTFCKKSLNLMIKSWMMSGIHLWCKTEGVLYLTQYQAKYTLENTSTAAFATNKTDEIITSLSVDFNIGDTLLNVEDSSGMMIGDYIGIVLNDNSLYWSTISSVPNATSIIVTTMPTVNITMNALIYTFTSKVEKPMRVLDARLVHGLDSGATSSEYELIINPMGYETYMHMSIKSNNGQPNQYVYNPERDQGIIYLWPRPADCNYRMEFTYERKLEDLNTATDDFDFPIEWQETIVKQLAVRIAPRFGKEEKAIKLIAPMAAQLLDNLKMWDTEITSIFISPSRRNY